MLSMNPEDDPSYLKVKDAAQAVGFAREILDKANVDFRGKRFQFFDKLILLNGSALAFSATVLGYLQPRQQEPSRAILVLAVCWAVLFLSILFALLRNYLSPEATWHDAFEMYTRKKAEHQRADAEAMTHLKGEILDRYTFAPLDRDVEKQVAESNAGEWTRASQTAKRKAKRRYFWVRLFEIAALVTSCAGLALLVVFTVVNTRTVQSHAQSTPGPARLAGCGITAQLKASRVNALFNPNSMSLNYVVSNHSDMDYTLPDEFRALRKTSDGVLHVDGADLGLPKDRFFPRNHIVEFSITLLLGDLLDHAPTEKEKAELQKGIESTVSFLLFDEAHGCEIEFPAHQK
jgi:hypothetical protein